MNIATKGRQSISKRLFALVGKFFISFLYRIDHRMYMKIYMKYLSLLGINIEGKPTYIALSASFDSSDYSKITLHDKCVISGDVRLLTHDYSVSRVAMAKGIQLEKEFRVIKSIEIGENSFVGLRSIIMPGVKIGKNVVVGAGSIVTKSVGDNLIVAGNPAKIITTIDDYWEKIKTSNDIYYE